MSVADHGLAKTARWSCGPLEVWAYHDYPAHPWASPLYWGARLGRLTASGALMPNSRLRPFSGGRS